MLSAETLRTLAHAAEWMAEHSDASDRDGRCSAHLHTAAREARALAEYPVGTQVTTTVRGIGGRASRVAGEVVDHKRGTLAVRTASHGTIMVHPAEVV
jgi:hypothetical protein